MYFPLDGSHFAFLTSVIHERASRIVGDTRLATCGIGG